MSPAGNIIEFTAAKMVRVVITDALAYLYTRAHLRTGPCACARYSESGINLSRRNVCQLRDNTEEVAVSGDV